MTKKRLLAILTVPFLALVLMGEACATKTTELRPGALNAFDQNSYDTLVTVQAALETASKEVAAHPNLKPELNLAIDGYNAAMLAYKVYHEAVSAGKPGDQAELATMIANLSAAVATIVGKLHPAAPNVPKAMYPWSIAA